MTLMSGMTQGLLNKTKQNNLAFTEYGYVKTKSRTNR